MLAQAQRDAGDLDGAEATARALHEAHPEDARFTYLVGQMLEARGRYQEIVDFLKPEIAKLKAVTGKNPQAAMLLGSEGLALQQLHKYDEALAAFKDAVALAPDDAVRAVLLIQGYTAAGRHKEAIDAAEKARAKFPDDATVTYQLGAALDRAGRRDESEKTFRALIADDPLDAGALNYLGYMLAEHGPAAHLDEAVSLIQRALKVDPDNPSFLDSLGWAYLQQGKLDLADTPLTTAAAKMPTNSVIQEHLGDLRQKQNRHADAIAAWQKALAGDGDAIDRSKIQKKIDSAKKSR
jgi:tetratricopeptide (TPR) repeat protein